MKSLVFQKQAMDIIVAQFIFVVFLTAIMTAGWGSLKGLAFLLGGLIAPLANTYFYFRVFSHFGARAARNIVGAFYRGEAVKIALTAVGFGIIFQIVWIPPLWVFMGYIMAQFGFALAAFWLEHRTMGSVGKIAR